MRLSLRTVAGLIVLISLTGSVSVAQMRFSQSISSHETQWSGTSSKVSCVLSYAITDYGRADFVMLSGVKKRLSLEIFPQVPLASRSSMRIVAAPPAWRHGGEERELGRIDLYKSFNPFVGDSVAWRALTALDEGMEILLPYRDRLRYPTQLVVPALSPIAFNAAYQDFLKCTGELIDIAFEDVSMNAVLFRENGTELLPVSRRDLDAQILYLQNDKAVNHVDILAFAYERATREENQALANERATALKQLFMNAGVPEAQITTRTYEDVHEAGSAVMPEERRYSARAVITLGRDVTLIDPVREAQMPDVGMPGASLPAAVDELN